MRWSCPHCGVALAIGDEKLGTGWSFSRCYKCGGFALIRRAEVNIIKVDKAPPGEQVLLPEGSPEPMLSENATQNLNAAKEAAARPVIRAAHPRNTNAGVNVPPPPMGASAYPTAPHDSFDIFADGFPEMNQGPSRGILNKKKLLPVAIGLAGVLSVSSGIYLYIQGQALWNKARTQASQDSIDTTPVKTVAHRETIIPAPALAESAPSAPKSELVDQVRHNAMAPVREEAAREQATPALLVKARIRGANIHTGPGMSFPVLATALAEKTYTVTSWSDTWFKISLGNDRTGWIRNDLVQLVTQP